MRWKGLERRRGGSKANKERHLNPTDHDHLYHPYTYEVHDVISSFQYFFSPTRTYKTLVLRPHNEFTESEKRDLKFLENNTKYRFKELSSARTRVKVFSSPFAFF